MSRQVFRAMYCGLFALLLVSNSIAQSERERAVAGAGDKYVISAKAGGVNYVEGTVAVVRKTGTSGYLMRRDEIQIGDRVSTGADGKAEILLNPGSYLRVGPNSAFEFISTSLDDVRIRVDSGSAIFEVYAADEFSVAVITPKTMFDLIESGVYRIDVLPQGQARIEVWEGKAQTGSSSVIVKKGRAEGRKPATTVTMFLGFWPRAFIANAGDSRYYRLRNGRLERFTVDQTMAEVMVEQGALTREKAEASRLKHVLWSAVGNDELRPDVATLDILRNDRHLLCTDGLTKHVSDEEIKAQLVRDETSEQIVRALIGLALERGGTDNVTVVVLRVAPIKP